MKKTIKAISLILTITLLCCFFPMSSFAAQIEHEYHVATVTWDDIMTMSNREFRALLAEFERVYDPFGTYENEPLCPENNHDIQPYWTSGDVGLDGLPTETGSHELITARACGILLDDKGFWGENRNASLLIALTISLASIKPDKEWLLGPIDLFKGHFYNPNTGKNWAGSSINTALSNTKKFYDKAKKTYSPQQQSEQFLENVGKMLHYIQDASEPHHAANITALEKDNVHSEFEKYADQNLNNCIDSFTSLGNKYYSDAVGQSVENLVHQTALFAYSYAPYVSDINNQSYWYEVAYATSRNAVQYSAMLLYKLSIELNIPLR